MFAFPATPRTIKADHRDSSSLSLTQKKFPSVAPLKSDTESPRRHAAARYNYEARRWCTAFTGDPAHRRTRPPDLLVSPGPDRKVKMSVEGYSALDESSLRALVSRWVLLPACLGKTNNLTFFGLLLVWIRSYMV